MANYYATTRSNYFRVKDATVFEAWCRKRFLDFWGGEDKPGYYAISGNETGWPYYDNDNDDDINLTEELGAHLDPRDVAVLLEIGNEKLRYIVGNAVAVHDDGQTVSINLDDIYYDAEQVFGPNVTITEATY